MEAAVIQLLIRYRYIVILPITIVEGPIVMLTTGFLLRLGYFSLVPLYSTLLIGDLVGDVAWYYVGYFGGMKFIKRFGKYVSITEDSIQKVEKIFNRHHSTILLTSKITMGFGFAVVTLFTAGLTRVPFGRYLAFNTIGGIVWTGILLGIGYYLGTMYLIVGRGFEIVAIIAGIIIALFLTFGFGKYIRSLLFK